MPANFGGVDPYKGPSVETALYYPYMQTPTSPWFTQVLLYWDDVATIVPDAYGPPVDQKTQDLVEVGLLRRMSPDDAVYGLGRHQFASTFLETVEPWQRTEIPSFTEIHAGKMSYVIFRELKEMGLARSSEGRDRGVWYRVENATANAFMAYLAGAMSGLTPGLTPVTDSLDHVAALSASGRSRKRKLEVLRYVAITEALPMPRGPVNADDLAAFKDQHRDELKLCRQYLDLQLMTLARADEDDDLVEHELGLRLAALRQETNELESELQAQMCRRGWSHFSRANFGAIAAAGLSSASTVVSGGSASATGLALGAAAAGLVDPIREYRSHRDSPDNRSPLLYAALATRLPSSIQNK